MVITVIVCTFNPRRDFLSRTLTALRRQTIPDTTWELILVDNNSSPALSSWVDLNGLPSARIVAEPQQGFTPALLRGLEETRGKICVLVHDDNLLAPDYLAEVSRLAQEWPNLGAWGGGYEPEYEVAPPPELAPFIAFLAVHPVSHDRWSNVLYDYPATPCGAGMAVRTEVLMHWRDLTLRDDRRRSLGRHTDKLTSCEDFDIAFTAIDLGLGTGVFKSLTVTHLIPKERVQRAYLYRLVEGHGYSSTILHSFRGQPKRPVRTLLARLRRWQFLQSLPTVDRSVQEALARGESRAYAQLDHNLT